MWRGGGDVFGDCTRVYYISSRRNLLLRTGTRNPSAIYRAPFSRKIDINNTRGRIWRHGANRARFRFTAGRASLVLTVQFNSCVRALYSPRRLKFIDAFRRTFALRNYCTSAARSPMCRKRERRTSWVGITSLVFSVPYVRTNVRLRNPNTFYLVKSSLLRAVGIRSKRATFDLTFRHTCCRLSSNFQERIRAKNVHFQ